MKKSRSFLLFPPTPFSNVEFLYQENIAHTKYEPVQLFAFFFPWANSVKAYGMFLDTHNNEYM